jgi:hypothetical protein
MHEELREALKKGLNLQAIEIEKNAFKMAIGGIEVSKKKYARQDGVMVLVEEVIEKTLPNVTMQIFMLKNLMPEKYRDTTDITFETKQKEAMDGVVKLAETLGAK